MLQALAYPFDSPELLRHRKQYRRQLLADNSQRIPKRIAVLGDPPRRTLCPCWSCFC